MSALLFGVAVLVVGVAALFVAYLVFLLVRFPEPVYSDEVHTVVTADQWRIRLHRRRPSSGVGEPVLLCHSLPLNRLNFELPHGSALVDVLLDAGYDCWLVDLRGCRDAAPPAGASRADVTVDDYLLKDLPAAITYIREATGCGQVHWIGHSLGGMLLYAFDLTFGREWIASGTTLGSPVGFKGVTYHGLARIRAFARKAPWLAQAFVQGISPFYRSVASRYPLVPTDWNNMHPDIGTGAVLNALELPPPKVAEEMEFWASNRVWRMREDKLDVTAELHQVQTPLLAIYGASDPFTPATQVREFFDALPNRDKRMLMLGRKQGHAADYRHMDLVYGRRCRTEVFEPIVEWLKAHPITARGAAPAKRKPAARKKPAANKKPAAKKSASARNKPAATKKAAAKKSATTKKPAAKKKSTATKKRSSG